MTFDQAYLLHGVRKKLRAEDLVTVVNDSGSFQRLEVGDFVEYKATFEPNLLTSALDVLTPEIVNRFAANQYAKNHIDIEIDESEEHVIMTTAGFLGQQASAVFESLQREFRNESSSEFYGSVLGAQNLAVHAVTICDKEMFAGADSDRILDGEFRVLGKVIQVLNDGYSMLDRNKILSRLKDGALQELESTMKAEEEVSKYIDTSLNLKHDGASFKVIPIAIFV